MSSLLDAIGQVGEGIDRYTGGRALRGTLAGRPRELLSVIPYSETMGLTRPEEKTSGRDLTDLYGLTTKGDNDWGSWGAGTAADMLLNPLSLAGGAAAFKAAPTFAKGLGAAAKSVSGLDALEHLAGLGSASRFKPLRDEFTMVKNAGAGLGAAPEGSRYGTLLPKEGEAVPRFVGKKLRGPERSSLLEEIEGSGSTEQTKAMRAEAASLGIGPENLAPVRAATNKAGELAGGEQALGGFYHPDYGAGAIMSEKYIPEEFHGNVGETTRHEVGHGILDQAIEQGPSAIRTLPPAWQPAAWVKYLSGNKTGRIGNFLDEFGQHVTENRGLGAQLKGGWNFLTHPEYLREYAGKIPASIAEFMRDEGGWLKLPEIPAEGKARTDWIRGVERDYEQALKDTGTPAGRLKSLADVADVKTADTLDPWQSTLYPNKNSYAVYKPFDQKIYPNILQFPEIWLDPDNMLSVLRGQRKNWTSNISQDSMAVHEIGHGLHHKNLADYYGVLPGGRGSYDDIIEKLSPLHQKAITSQISEYGASNPKEFVAEKFLKDMYDVAEGRRPIVLPSNDRKALDFLYSSMRGPIPHSSLLEQLKRLGVGA